jgi:hypothetical protein
MIWGAGNIWMTGDNRIVGFSTDSTTDSIPNVGLQGSGNDFIINNWSGSAYNENLRVYGSSRYTQAAGSLRAPIFYDSDNTAFYLDPAGTSNINGLNGNGKQVLNTGDTYLRINESGAFTAGTWFGSTNIMHGTGYFASGSNGSTTNSRVYIYGGTYNGTNVISLDGSNGIIDAT